MLVHGDITLDNLLVATSGIVKIGDFSISQLVEDENDELCCSTGIPIITTSECCIGSTYHSKVAAVWVVGFTRMIILYRKVLLGHTLNSPTFPPKEENPSQMSKKDLVLKYYQITASYGKGSIMWLGRSAPVKQVPVVSTGSFALDIAFGIGRLPKKLNVTILTGDFTKLDFDSYNGPSRGYNQLGSIGYSTE
ncbi:serine/threonine-protein kinase GRIK1-like isoform X2 [Coffea eugenioides]|uniref:serine/threonine-protein kinase GRIK1-like isoform X2 n=1 Tax=Coffea eugenioides TaxID=49369 RepID=UPI000F614F8A|nr:serine/threonine-protein kinase GRIK1-like isoform X2 [Coffea eugenioides]